MTIKLSELRKVKGIGKVAMDRVTEHLDKLEGDKAYVSKYDESIHVNPGDLVQGDMLEVMNGIPDGSVDMILTDLPYGTTACSWDSVIDFDKMWKQYNRVIKDNGAVVLFGSEPFSSQLRNSNIDDYKYDWVWNKKKPGNIFLARYQPMKIHENILVFSKKTHIYKPIKTRRKEVRVGRNYGTGEAIGGNNMPEEKVYVHTHKNPQSIITYSNANQQGKTHPTQKPVALLEYLIKTYTNEDEVVLDSTMGSGSTGVACENTNRQFIGIELDEEYFKIAQSRIEDTEND